MRYMLFDIHVLTVRLCISKTLNIDAWGRKFVNLSLNCLHSFVEKIKTNTMKSWRMKS